MPPKLPLPLGDPGMIMMPWANLSPHPEQHFDWFSYFNTAHGLHLCTPCMRCDLIFIEQFGHKARPSVVAGVSHHSSAVKLVWWVLTVAHRLQRRRAAHHGVAAMTAAVSGHRAECAPPADRRQCRDVSAAELGLTSAPRCPHNITTRLSPCQQHDHTHATSQHQSRHSAGVTQMWVSDWAVSSWQISTLQAIRYHKHTPI